MGKYNDLQLANFIQTSNCRRLDSRFVITARPTHLGCPCIQWDIISAKMVSADVKSDEEDTRKGNDGLEGRERQFRSAVSR